MSPTTEDLRRRMADELAGFGEIPDLATAAIAAGRRRRRRRRRAAGALAGAALAACAAVPVALLAGGGGSSAPTPQPGRIATDPVGPPTELQRAAAVRATVEADGVVTRAEWDRAVVATLDALLPSRFGSVEAVANDAVSEVRTTTGSPRLELWLGVGGVDGRVDVQPGWGGCRELRDAAASVEFRFDVLDCADARLRDGLRARAELEHVVTGTESDTPGSETYGGSLIVLGETVFTELAVGAVDRGTPAGIEADELLAIAVSEDYLDLLRIGVLWARDAEPTHGGASIGASSDPVWPGQAS